MDSPERPTKEDLERIAKLGPRIATLLQRIGCPSGAGAEIVREALFALVHQWDGVTDREWWLLDRIEKAARRHVNRSREEPQDEEEPPS